MLFLSQECVRCTDGNVGQEGRSSSLSRTFVGVSPCDLTAGARTNLWAERLC